MKYLLDIKTNTWATPGGTKITAEAEATALNRALASVPEPLNTKVTAAELSGNIVNGMFVGDQPVSARVDVASDLFTGYVQGRLLPAPAPSPAV